MERREHGAVSGGLEPAADAQIGDTRIESAGRVTTLVNHLGISACDLAYAELLLDLAEKQNVGTLLAR